MPLIISPRKRFLKEYFKKYQKMPVKFENWAGQKIGLHLSNYCFLMSKTVFEGEIPILQELFDVSAFLLSFCCCLFCLVFFLIIFFSNFNYFCWVLYELLFQTILFVLLSLLRCLSFRISISIITIFNKLSTGELTIGDFKPLSLQITNNAVIYLEIKKIVS